MAPLLDIPLTIYLFYCSLCACCRAASLSMYKGKEMRGWMSSYLLPIGKKGQEGICGAGVRDNFCMEGGWKISSILYAGTRSPPHNQGSLALEAFQPLAPLIYSNSAFPGSQWGIDQKI